MLLKQAVWRAFARAWAKTGKRIAARMAMIAITTSNSISVNPRFGIGTVSFPVFRFITIEFSTKKCTPFVSSQQLLRRRTESRHARLVPPGLPPDAPGSGNLPQVEVCGLYHEKVLTSDCVPVLAGVSLPAQIAEAKVRQRMKLYGFE